MGAVVAGLGLATAVSGQSAHPEQLVGTACPGYTVTNYMAQYQARKATEDTASHCALAFSRWDSYLKAIRANESSAKIDQLYADYRRDATRAVEFAAGSKPAAPAPSSTGSVTPPKPPGSAGTVAKCAPLQQQTTRVEFSASSPSAARAEGTAAIEKHVRALCHGPATLGALNCKVVTYFGDYVCRPVYTCAETSPSCTPAPR